MKHTGTKKHIISVLCFFLAAFLTFAAIPYDYFSVKAIDTSKDNESALRSKLEEYQNESAEIKKKLDKTKNDISSQENEKQYLDSLVLATENEIETANQLLEEYSNKIAEKEQEIADCNADIEDKYNSLLNRLSFIYEEENYDNYLGMILDADTLSDALMTVERIGSMLDFDNTLMSELSARLELLKSEKQALADTKASQEELKASLEEKEKELEAQKAAVQDYIKELQANEAAYKAEYDKAKKAEEQANAEIEKLLAARAAQQAASRVPAGGGTPAAISGEFTWPAPAAYSKISSGYGWRNLWGRMDFHLGIDIPYPYGTNVFAAKAGTVVTATWHYSYGYYVLIDHGDGTATLYAHNSKLLVSPGQHVDQKQVIAKGGSTGNSSGNHCHFEIRFNGKTVNPASYVTRP